MIPWPIDQLTRVADQTAVTIATMVIGAAAAAIATSVVTIRVAAGVFTSVAESSPQPGPSVWAMSRAERG